MTDPVLIQGLEDFPTAPVLIPVGDGEHAVLGCVHLTTPNTAEIPHAVCYLVSLATWSVVKVIGQSLPLVKDSGVALLILPNLVGPQTVVMVVTEEGAPRGGGFTNVMNVYTYPDAVPAPKQWIDQVGMVQFSRLENPKSGVARLVQKTADDAAKASTEALARALGIAVGTFVEK